MFPFLEDGLLGATLDVDVEVIVQFFTVFPGCTRDGHVDGLCIEEDVFFVFLGSDDPFVDMLDEPSHFKCLVFDGGGVNDDG